MVINGNSVIKTERLTLKEIEEKDREALFDILCSEKVNCFYMVPPLDTSEARDKMFAYFRDTSASKSVFLKGIFLQDRLIGFINQVSVEDNIIEIGWALDPEYHNKGYMTEAAACAADFLLKRGYSAVRAGAFEENPASMRVMEKIGMHRIQQTEEIEYKGKVHHCICWQLP